MSFSCKLLVICNFVEHSLSSPFHFLDAPSHFYKRLCPSVRPQLCIFNRVLGASCAVCPALFSSIVNLSLRYGPEQKKTQQKEPSNDSLSLDERVARFLAVLDHRAVLFSSGLSLSPTLFLRCPFLSQYPSLFPFCLCLSVSPSFIHVNSIVWTGCSIHMWRYQRKHSIRLIFLYVL